MVCPLDYIPQHLHTNNQPIVESFSVGEELYYRSKPENLQKPYDKIPLYDISHNRNFCDSQTYPKDDVLFNIIEEDPEKIYEEKEVVVLNIKNLENKITYTKEIICRDDNEIVVLIELKHDPVPCMYPHSVFEISLNGIIVNNENYSKTIGKNNRKFKNLRSDIRQELTSIIQTGNIDSSKDIEFIDEP